MKTLKLLLLLFVPLFVKAQTWQPQYLGQENTNVIVRKAFTLPKDSLGWGNIRMYDTTLQYKVGSSWRVVGSGSGTSVDSSNFQKVSNKVTTLTNSTIQYPSTSAIRDSIYTKSFTYTKAQTDSAITAKQVFAKNGLRKQGDTVKLGLELAPPYTNGVLTEDLYLIKGSVLSENFKGLVISDVDITGITTISPIESAPNTGSTLRSGVSGTGITSDLTTFYDRVEVGTNAGTSYYKGMIYKQDNDSAFNSNDRSIPDVGWVKDNIGTGWASYTDTLFKTATPFTISSGITDTLENGGQSTTLTQLPLGVTSLYNPVTKKFVAAKLGDAYTISVRFKAKNSATNGYFTATFDVGGALAFSVSDTKTFAKGAGVEHSFVLDYNLFAGALWLANGGTLKITADSGNLQIYDINYLITRTHKGR